MHSCRNINEVTLKYSENGVELISRYCSDTYRQTFTAAFWWRIRASIPRPLAMLHVVGVRKHSVTQAYTHWHSTILLFVTLQTCSVITKFSKRTTLLGPVHGFLPLRMLSLNLPIIIFVNFAVFVLIWTLIWTSKPPVPSQLLSFILTVL